jgi:dolichol-phosphate mannosyltransferase
MVLDDASPDGTGALADRLAAEEPRIQVVHRAEKLGSGKAYIHGFHVALAANYDYIVQMDADFSHPPDALPTMLELAQHYDVVLGSRWIAGGQTRHWPLRRQWLSRGGNFYARTLLGLAIQDLTGGFKCFRREVLEALEVDSIQGRGYLFQIEMTYRAAKMGFRIHEFPFVFEERRRGTSKMSLEIVAEALYRVPLLRLFHR